MTKGTRNNLVIPYFISIGFTAVSINSLARGINNHETWRIIIAAIGGGFFLFVAIVMMIRLVKASGNRKPRNPKRIALALSKVSQFKTRFKPKRPVKK